MPPRKRHWSDEQVARFEATVSPSDLAAWTDSDRRDYEAYHRNKRHRLLEAKRAQDPEYRARRIAHSRKWRESAGGRAWFAKHMKAYNAQPENQARLAERKATIEFRFNNARWVAQNSRNIAWRLDAEQFAAVFAGGATCHYCGDENEIYGLDRKDADGCYEPENVVSCCISCNRSKQTLPYATFLACCAHIAYRRRVGASTSPPPEGLFEGRKRRLYRSTLLAQAASRKHDVALTDDERTAISESPCRYCGLPEARGIDRVDNALGYTSANSVPCCKTCNFLKYTQTVDEFYARCERIAARHPAAAISSCNARA